MAAPSLLTGVLADLEVESQALHDLVAGLDASGLIETWGPATAAQRVRGAAEDFCLLVTQRRHRSELDVHAEGPDAERWLGVAQAFAGPPGPGRAARPAG